MDTQNSPHPLPRWATDEYSIDLYRKLMRLKAERKSWPLAIRWWTRWLFFALLLFALADRC